MGGRIMAQWIEGRIAENRQWSDRLHSLQVKADIEPFEAGQFAKLGLSENGEIVSRPYSLVNPPDAALLEFYFIVVPGGELSGRLASLQSGDSVFVTAKASGMLTLAQTPSARHLFLLSTGTGIGPFLSMLRTAIPWQRFEKVVLVHAVRLIAELNYREVIEEIEAAHPQQFVYIPFVSREPCEFALSGRVPQAILDGRLESKAGVVFQPVESHVMLCGNPQMVEDTTKILMDRGLRRHKRREPGEISVESYW
jgi:ferredoxin--NADP+ reductase